MKNKKIQNIFALKNIMTALLTIAILTWAFFQNNNYGKIIISPFLICSLAFLGKNLFFLLNKEKISHIFKKIFRLSFFAYVFGFLIYAFYYSITTQSYPLIIPVIIFLLFTIRFIKTNK